MNNMNPGIPILVMAFSRPKQTKRILQQIELLNARSVHISVDGSSNEMDYCYHQNREVRSVILDWASRTKHEVSFNFFDHNLGLFKHFRIALSDFFLSKEAGLILEDDIEFDKSFIDYLDKIYKTQLFTDYWSVCGHNPIRTKDKSFSKSNLVFMRPTNVHTIWGWAAGRQTIEDFLMYLDGIENGGISPYSTLEDFTKRAFSDPLLSYQFKESWNNKILRARNSLTPNWDNFWVLAGWHSGKYSLIADTSLSRENPDQSEGQTHPHVSALPNWSNASNREFLVSGVRRRSLLMERKLLGVWGVSARRSIGLQIMRLKVWVLGNFEN